MLLDVLRVKYSDMQIARIFALCVQSLSAIEGIRLPAVEWDHMESDSRQRLQKERYGNRVR